MIIKSDAALKKPPIVGPCVLRLERWYAADVLLESESPS
jgi:hypothetical protein